MVNAYCVEGMISFTLLFVCSCAYVRRVPRLRAIVDKTTKGPAGIIYKGVWARVGVYGSVGARS